MASKQAILLHLEGVEACDQQDWLKAIAIFQQVDSPSSVIMFNIGSCYLQLKQYEKAEDAFKECVLKDRYLAVGYFQQAVAQTYMQNYSGAIMNFNACHDALRGNTFIHYKQLNMVCKVYDCDVRFNLAILCLFTGEHDLALEHLQKAVELAANNHFAHRAIAAVMTQDWEVFGLTPLHKLITLESSCLFRPSKAKLEGIQSGGKFMNSAKVVSATNDEYSFVGFVGPKKLQKQRETESESLVSTMPVISGMIPPPLPSVAPPRRSKPPSEAPPPVPSNKPPPPPSDEPPPPPIKTKPLRYSNPSPSLFKNIPSPPANSPPPLRKLPLSQSSTTFPTNPYRSSSPLTVPATIYPPKISPPVSPLRLSSSPAKFPPSTSPAKDSPPTPPPKLHSSPPTEKPLHLNGFQDSRKEALRHSKPNGFPVSKPAVKSKVKVRVNRPPPPSKESIKSGLKCCVTIPLTLPKNKINSYDEFSASLIEKLQRACEDIQHGTSVMNVMHPTASDDNATAINATTWKEVYIQAARHKKLEISITERKMSGGNRIKKEHLGQIRTKKVPKEIPLVENEDDIYVDAGAHNPILANSHTENIPEEIPLDENEEGIYVDASAHNVMIACDDEADDTYAASVFSGATL